MAIEEVLWQYWTCFGNLGRALARMSFGYLRRVLAVQEVFWKFDR